MSRLSQWLFYARLLTYVIAPVGVVYGHSSVPATVASAVLVCTLITGFLIGDTFWISIRPLPLLIQVAWLALATGIWLYAWMFSWPVWIFCLLMMLCTASDIVIKPQREFWLLAASLFILLERHFLRDHTSNRYGHELYMPIIIGLTARSGWKKYESYLMHASLDYAFARIELLSYGMQRLLAVGFKRNIREAPTSNFP